MRTIMAAFLAFLVLAVTPVGVRAGDVAPEVKADVERIIASQIDAFRRDDGVAAFAFAAPEIQLKFQNPQFFMSMVQQGYKPVYRPQSFEFTAIEEVNGLVRQLVDLVGPDGDLWTAEYLLRRMPDGTLRIAACSLRKRDAVGA